MDYRENNKTALMLACERGNRAIIHHLYDHGFNLNATDHTGCTPLISAVKRQDTRIVQYLLEAYYAKGIHSSI